MLKLSINSPGLAVSPWAILRRCVAFSMASTLHMGTFWLIVNPIISLMPSLCLLLFRKRTYCFQIPPPERPSYLLIGSAAEVAFGGVGTLGGTVLCNVGAFGGIGASGGSGERGILPNPSIYFIFDSSVWSLYSST